MLKQNLFEVKYKRLSKKSQAVILYDFIQNRLFLNLLQKIFVEKALNYAIINNWNQ